MKILLTIVANGKNAVTNAENVCDGVEILYPDEGENDKQYLSRACKAMKGKYALICAQKLTLADMQSVLNILDKNTADMVCFVGGAIFKASVLKNVVKDCEDNFSFRTLAVMNCKSLLKTVYNPFLFGKESSDFSEDNVNGLIKCAEEFGKMKAKLPKEIYSYTFNLLCDRLVIYYMYAMLAIKDGKLEADKLVEFDSKLKAEIVLYLALEKRFTATKLHKLREKNYKISFLTAMKFRKLLK